MAAGLLLLDLARLLAGVTLLSFASFTDWRWRRAPNVLWVVLAAVGATLLLVHAALDLADLRGRWPYLVAAPIFAAFVYVLWYFGLLAGGADAKALLAIALLLPFPIALAFGLPRWPSLLPGSFAVLGNSLLAFLVIPLSLLAWNLAHGDARLPHAFLGVKKRAADVRRGHQWPMEFVAPNGARTTRLFASRLPEGEVDEAFARLQALGDARVWVSPKVPFMIPLLVGFVAAFVLGDLMSAMLSRLLPHA